MMQKAFPAFIVSITVLIYCIVFEILRKYGMKC